MSMYAISKALAVVCNHHSDDPVQISSVADMTIVASFWRDTDNDDRKMVRLVVIVDSAMSELVHCTVLQYSSAMDLFVNGDCDLSYTEAHYLRAEEAQPRDKHFRWIP